MGMITVVTDVVRENNQTYRLGWSEQCKDGSRMGVGMPEYVLLFRKPPTDSSDGYADERVVKDRRLTTLVRVGRSTRTASGVPTAIGSSRAEELVGAGEQIFKRFRDHSLTQVYDYEHHVAIGETLEGAKRLPPGFMLPPATELAR
jgi:hypothetical protein